MRQVAPNYSISGQAVTLSGVNVPISQILLVSNATSGNLVYSSPNESNGIFRNLGISYSQGTNSTLTFPSGVTFGATDKLYIAYDDGLTTQSVNNTSTQFSKVSLSTASFARPGNTTAYTINNVVSNATGAAVPMTFSGVLPVNQADGYIVGVRAMTTQSSFATALRLHLYKNSGIASNLNDGSGYNLLYTDFSNRLGYVDISSWTTAGASSDSATAFGIFPGGGSTLPIELASGSNNLYGVLENRAAFTPVSGQQFSISLKTQLA
jgi:hypothetical protein